jgi:hypothetical protein
MDGPNEIADLARVNAIAMEAKKDGLSQRQGGDWALRFTVSAIDMDVRITKAPMGTRYQMVLVEITDDETPKDFKAQDRDKWRELGATKQAGIRCKDPIFWAYLHEELHFRRSRTKTWPRPVSGSNATSRAGGIWKRSETRKHGESGICWIMVFRRGVIARITENV